MNEKWRCIWINRDDDRYADLLAEMWKDIECRGKFGRVVRALEEIKNIVHDKQTPKIEKINDDEEIPSLGLRALTVMINAALESRLEIYEQLPDANLFMYDRLGELVIDPEYIQERQTLDDTCTQLKHLLVQVHDILRTRWVDSISYRWHEFCRLMKEYFGTVLQEPENVETQSVRTLLLQLKQCGR